MSKILRFALLALVVFTTACSGRRSLAPTNSGSYPTPQIVTGFGQPATPVPAAPLTPTVTTLAPTLAPTAPPAVITRIVAQTVVAAPSATAAPEAVPTFVPTPTSPPAAGIHCDNPSATITWPPMNAEIHGIVPITGTASTQDFVFYKVQYMPDSSWGSEKWGELYQDTHRVNNGKLMSWDTTTVEPGVYWIRLLVTHSNGQYGDPCEIRVVVP